MFHLLQPVMHFPRLPALDAFLTNVQWTMGKRSRCSSVISFQAESNLGRSQRENKVAVVVNLKISFRRIFSLVNVHVPRSLDVDDEAHCSRFSYDERKLTENERFLTNVQWTVGKRGFCELK